MSSSSQDVENSSGLQSATASNSSDASSDSQLPGIFLMTNSFETGGSERQFMALARSLDRAAFRVHLGCIMRKGAFDDGLDDVPEFGLGRNAFGFRSWRSRVQLARHLRRLRITIAHSFDFYTNLVLIPAARLARVPVVIGSQRQLGDLLTSSKFRAQTAVFRFADAVICNSHAAASGLFRAGIPERRLVVIHNGLPDDFFRPGTPAMPPSASVLRVGVIARMNTWSKNHRIFLTAAARLARKHSNLEFVLVGDGPLRRELELVSKNLQIGDRVQFLGDRKDIQDVLAALHVSVLPSESESFSNAILESMAAGVPVVATDVGGNSELIGDGRGVLVPRGNEAELASAIEQLVLNANARAEIGAKAREFARAHFTIENMRRQHEAMYRELLEKKRWSHRRADFTRRSDGQPSSALRCAIVCASPRYVGGHSVQAELLLRGWKHDRRVEAKLIPIDPPLPKPIRWAERLPGLRTIVREPLYIFQLWKGFRDVDVAHIFSASYWSFLIAPAPAWLVARLRGRKVLIHYHSGEAQDHLRRSRIARYILKRSDELVVPSGYLVDVFSEFGLNARVVPNVIDPEQFAFRLREQLRPHLVCTRGFHPYYAVDVVVRAFAQVQDAFPNARLDLVGRGPEEAAIRNLVKSLGLSGVNFAGVAPRQDIARFYDEADIFINASRLDNMPVSILEAFAAGTPVVTTAPEGMGYLVEHERTGLLSTPGDAHALAANVLRLLKDPALARQLALNAHKECDRYRWSTVRENWLEIYRTMGDRDKLGSEQLAGAAGR
ncbi:MAG TPA: glycosyltransferase [Terriglobales bacterium]|nr:glycosyltransferase [Terriglobales bacterium]